MFGKKNVALTMTERAREIVDAWGKSSKLNSPVIGIAWGRSSGASDDKFDLGFYEHANMPMIEGWLGIAPEFEFIVIQEWVLDALDNKTLDIDDHGQIVITPVPDIPIKEM